jgi:hypothetical protein
LQLVKLFLLQNKHALQLIAEDLDRVNILWPLLSLLGPAATSSVCLLVSTTMLCSLVYELDTSTSKRRKLSLILEKCVICQKSGREIVVSFTDRSKLRFFDAVDRDLKF